MADPSAGSLKIFDCGARHASDAAHIAEIGGRHKSSEPVELYLTPPSRTVGHLYFGTC
jgi:hypothetical protein